MSEGKIHAFLNKPLRVRVVRGILLAALVAAVVTYIPTPFYLEAPGKADDVGTILSIESSPTYPSKGKFILPTVVSEPATLLYCIYGLLDPEATLRSAPHGPQAQTGDSDSSGQMELSQQLSTLVALQELGYDLKPKLLGLRVVALEQSSPNHSQIFPGDILTAAEGNHLESVMQLRTALDQLGNQGAIPLEIQREGKKLEVLGSTYSPRGRPVLGLNLRPVYEPFKFPVKVNFHSGNTSGASGGLVFALAIYDLLTPEDLTQGRIIAATGTLDSNGEVGPIEGLEMKLKGAQRVGATIALVPKSNYEELTWMPDGMKVIPVETFNEALDVLRR